MPAWPQDVKHHLHVFHPMNSHGTTWLRESDLVFLKHKAYAVFSWSHDQGGDHPMSWCELNPELLHHDRADRAIYRYDGELRDPGG